MKSLSGFDLITIESSASSGSVSSSRVVTQSLSSFKLNDAIGERKWGVAGRGALDGTFSSIACGVRAVTDGYLNERQTPHTQ